eukprot:12672795-Alexandrium_andersonii.AAC.1
MAMASQELRRAGRGELVKLSVLRERRRVALLARHIVQGEGEAGARVTFDPDTLLPVDHGKRR